jgi:hypothetical protein
MRIVFLLLAAILLAASCAPSRRATGYQVVLRLALPMGDLKDYIDNDSWLGFGLDIRTFTKENVSFGLQVGYSEFYNNTTDLINLPSAAISGDQYRHLISVPLMLSAFLHGGHQGYGARPYIGVNAGAYYTHQSINIGTIHSDTDNWVFGVAPELGLLLPVRGSVGTVLHARYNYPISGGTFLSGQARSFRYLTIGIGFYSRR